jgi:hypothetical protein
MKNLVILLAVLGCVASHKFFAETNFICTTCKESMKLIKNGEVDRLAGLLKRLPKAYHLVENSMEHYQTMKLNKLSIDEICVKLNMCVDDFEDFVIDHDEHIRTVNSMKTTWHAGNNNRFLKTKASEVRKTLGTIVDRDWMVKIPTANPEMFIGELPENFDSRAQWSKCTEIGKVRDQANCGSCWAFGTTEAFNDRNCIQDGFNTLMSTADTTGCCGFLSCMSQGCNVGQIGTPWDWFHKTGVVTGGQMGDSTTCYPYTMPQCEHHVPGSKPNCANIEQKSP